MTEFTLGQPPTIEQLKQMQSDAGIPNLPTHLTYECRLAISDLGPRAFDWQDKPHRLVYDLCRVIEANAAETERLKAEAVTKQMHAEAKRKLQNRNRKYPDESYTRFPNTRMAIARIFANLVVVVLPKTESACLSYCFALTHALQLRAKTVREKGQFWRASDD